MGEVMERVFGIGQPDKRIDPTEAVGAKNAHTQVKIGGDSSISGAPALPEVDGARPSPLHPKTTFSTTQFLVLIATFIVGFLEGVLL